MTQVVQAGLNSRAYIEYLVRNIALCGQKISPSNIVNINEVHCLTAVPEDQRRGVAFDCVQPTNQYLGVNPRHVHSRTVNVEVAQSDVVQAGGCEKCTQHLFQGDFSCPVHSSIVKGMSFVNW